MKPEPSTDQIQESKICTFSDTGVKLLPNHPRNLFRDLRTEVHCTSNLQTDILARKDKQPPTPKNTKNCATPTSSARTRAIFIATPDEENRPVSRNRGLRTPITRRWITGDVRGGVAKIVQHPTRRNSDGAPPKIPKKPGGRP